MLQIDPEAEKKMNDHAVSIFPDECCGFMYGSEEADGNRTVSEIVEVNNAKNGDKRRRFEISPSDYMKGEQYAFEKDKEFLGIYHSHPNHPAIPSEQDRVAAQPYFSYVIISVLDGKKDITRSWRLNDKFQFEEENILQISFIKQS